MKISRSVFGAGKFCRPFLGAARENILESVGLHVSDRLSAAWTSSCGESIKPTTFSQIKVLIIIHSFIYQSILYSMMI